MTIEQRLEQLELQNQRIECDDEFVPTFHLNKYFLYKLSVYRL